MKKFNFPLERMLNYQEQDLEKERGISLACMSPREQLAFWKKEGVEPEAAEEVRRLYEKARYSQGQVTEEEAERMKILLD